MSYTKIVSSRQTTPFTPYPRHLQSGFTLPELTIVVAVIGILASIVLPAWGSAIAKVGAMDARSQLSATLLQAQSQATILGREIVVCPAPTGQCVGGTDWSQGWIAFIDHNGNRRRDPGEPRFGEVHALKPGIRLNGSLGRQRIVFQPRGSSAGSNTTFTLCDRRGPKHAVALILANSGRLRAAVPTPAAAASCVAGL